MKNKLQNYLDEKLPTFNMEAMQQMYASASLYNISDVNNVTRHMSAIGRVFVPTSADGKELMYPVEMYIPALHDIPKDKTIIKILRGALQRAINNPIDGRDTLLELLNVPDIRIVNSKGRTKIYFNYTEEPAEEVSGVTVRKSINPSIEGETVDDLLDALLNVKDPNGNLLGLQVSIHNINEADGSFVDENGKLIDVPYNKVIGEIATTNLPKGTSSISNAYFSCKPEDEESLPIQLGKPEEVKPVKKTTVTEKVKKEEGKQPLKQEKLDSAVQSVLAVDTTYQSIWDSLKGMGNIGKQSME